MYSHSMINLYIIKYEIIPSSTLFLSFFGRNPPLLASCQKLVRAMIDYFYRAHYTSHQGAGTQVDCDTFVYYWVTMHSIGTLCTTVNNSSFFNFHELLTGVHNVPIECISLKTVKNCQKMSSKIVESSKVGTPT